MPKILMHINLRKVQKYLSIRICISNHGLISDGMRVFVWTTFGFLSCRNILKNYVQRIEEWRLNREKEIGLVISLMYNSRLVEYFAF